MNSSKSVQPSSSVAERTAVAVVAALRGHPCLQDVHAAALPAHSGDDEVVVWVQPEPSSVRVPAQGRCTLIGELGEEFLAELVDVSFDGLSVRLLGAHLPEIGAGVQANVEAATFGGGVEGWLGTVCWLNGRDLGVAFAGNWDERGALQRFMHDCAAAESLPPAATSSDGTSRTRCPRVALDVPCELEFADGERLCLRSIDLSASGVGLKVRESGDGAQSRLCHGAGVTVRLRVHGGGDHALPGVVVRRCDGFAAVAFEPEPAHEIWLRGLVEQAMRTRLVSTLSLQYWLGTLDLPEPQALVHFRVVDKLPRDAASGEVQIAALPMPFVVS